MEIVGMPAGYELPEIGAVVEGITEFAGASAVALRLTRDPVLNGPKQ
ncbi:hypothetical protein ACFFV7_39595 [Nonomuraea spiralis]|uniref:Uncharacterized protein n=1 Tax=Nonomuraea spiralis TaxID=46182 RepID=A0ABV5IS13_9ACTN|nr:hypothetical protein [Nonomuraea spiralis]GGT34892.1 hypothetical protein GCM10010176_094050 [Nonomuraea spiralis]